MIDFFLLFVLSGHHLGSIRASGSDKITRMIYLSTRAVWILLFRDVVLPNKWIIQSYAKIFVGHFLDLPHRFRRPWVFTYNSCESETAHAKQTHLSCLRWRVSSWISDNSRRHLPTCCTHHSIKFPSLRPWGRWNWMLCRLLGRNGGRAKFWPKKIGTNGRLVSLIRMFF